MVKQIKPEVESFARIRVIGVGGSGNNAINYMIRSKVRGVDFIAVNTDAQALHNSPAKKKIHIGKNITRGLGTGMNPELGKRSAEETKEEIQEALKGSDMVFVTGGMGGGTGTGASPSVAAVARELGALTIGVVTRPFSFEGKQRSNIAQEGINELKKQVDALVMIPNDRIFAVVDENTGIKNAFALCDDILKQAVEGIADLITTPGIINVDFADIRSVMENAGSALMGIGRASGDKRAVKAAEEAINSPLLDVSIDGATGVLFAIAGGDDMSMMEVQEAANTITSSVDPDAKVIFGAISDSNLKKGEVKVTVIATGFPEADNLANDVINTDEKESSFFGGSTKEKEVQKPEEKSVKVTHSATPVPPIKSTKSTQTTTESVSGSARVKKTEPKKDDHDDDWSAIPSFLKRSK
mgnify:CR=1 FL=1